jgi:hypothetical protein
MKKILMLLLLVGVCAAASPHNDLYELQQYPPVTVLDFA